MLDFFFFFLSFCYSSTFGGHWESECIAWNLCIFIVSPPVRLMHVVVCFCFVFSSSRSRSPKSFRSYPLPHLGSPAFLIESMVWMWEFSSVRIRMYCLKFLYLHFSPVRLMRVVIFFIFFVFYLSRSRSPRCFALTASSALLIESYGVSVGMSSAAASHSHIY